MAVQLTGCARGFNRQSVSCMGKVGLCCVACNYIWQQQGAPLWPILLPLSEMKGLGENLRENKEHFEMV